MDVDQLQIQSDLLALRQLYGLLQNIIGFGVPNISLENVGKLLDKKALQLLKSLLDGAKERLSKRLSTDLQNHVVYSEPTELRFSSDRKPKFPIGNSSTYLCSTSLVMDEKLLPEFSKEVAEAILEIDSRILASRNQMMKLNPVKNYRESLMEEKYKTSYDEIPSRIESMSRGTIYVNGLRLPVSHDDRGDPSTRPNCGNVDRIINPTVGKASSTSRKTTRSCGHDHHKIIMRPTLLIDDRQENQRRSSRVMSSDSSSSIGSERKLDDSDTGPARSFSSSPSSSATEEDDQESDCIDQTQSSSSYSRSPIRINPTRTYFPRRVRDYSEKGTGRLRRIKNKLGLIFHHHHHHHHHHHDHHRSSNWKLLQKIFHSKNNKHVGVKDRKAIERKSVVRRSGGHNKNIKHFNALVEGLMKHVGGRGGRVLKKPGTGGGGGRNNTRLGKRKGGKGLGWWHRFGGRGGMKTVNRRGRVRVVRFAKKTPKLKM